MIYLRTGIGIEFRDDDLLFASFQSNFSGGAFTHFLRIADYHLRSREDLRRDAAAFFRGHGLSKDAVVLGIPRKDMVFRQLELPAEVKENLREVIRYQVQSFAPTEDDGFYYDYEIINDQPGQKRLAILLAMVRKSLLDDRLRLLRHLDIRPVRILGSSMGLANLFLQYQKDSRNSTFLVADMNRSGMELMALRQDRFVYSRETERKADSSWNDLFLHEVNEAVSKLRLTPEGVLEKIVLAGESSEAAFGDIKQRIPDCELFNKKFPFEVPVENRIVVQEAACAIGLAYSGIARHPSVKMNLLPPELKSRQARLAYITAALLGVVIVLLMIGLGIRQTVQNRLLQSQLEQELKTLAGPAQKALKLRMQGETLQARAKSIEDLLQRKDRNLEILKELTVILPNDAFLQSYSNVKDVVQLVGYSGASSDLNLKLDKSPLLKDVVQKGIVSKDSLTGKDRFTFEAKLEK